MELFRYRKAYEKIAMGFLSYIPTEKMLKKLQETITLYQEDPNWHLYLLKREEDFIALVGVMVDVEEGEWTLQHLSVNPSYRNEGIARYLVDQMYEKYGHMTAKGTVHTRMFLK